MEVARRILERAAGKRNLIWDWNGTFLDDLDCVVRIINRHLLERDLPLVDIERHRALFGFPIIKYYERLGFDFSRESFQDLSHKFVEDFIVEARSLRLHPESLFVAREHRGQGGRQAVLSASDQMSLDELVSHYGVADIFDHVCGLQDREARCKIDRGRELLEMTGWKPSETLLIGDTSHDREVAEALGLEVFLVPFGHQTVHLV